MSAEQIFLGILQALVCIGVSAYLGYLIRKQKEDK